MALVDNDDPNTPGSVRSFDYYGQPSRQRLTRYDPDVRVMSWESTEAFDPTLSHYAATIRLWPVTVSGDTFVEWWSDFDASDDSVDIWRAHQEREFRKSLERLNLVVMWSARDQ